MSQSNEVGCISWFDKFLRAVTQAFLYVGMAIIIGLTLLIVVHVTGRYLLDKPVPGQVELAVFMLITAVFLIIAYTEVVKGHTKIGIIVDRYPKRVQAAVDSLAYILCLALGILACWQAIVLGNYIKQVGQITTVLHMPQFPVNYAVAVGWGLFSLTILMNLVRSIIKAVKQ